MKEKQSSTSSKNTNVPVLTPEEREAKLQRARQKYGKPFAPEIRVKRSTPPSHVLLHIEGQQQVAAQMNAAKVRKIK